MCSMGGDYGVTVRIVLGYGRVYKVTAHAFPNLLKYATYTGRNTR